MSDAGTGADGEWDDPELDIEASKAARERNVKIGTVMVILAIPAITFALGGWVFGGIAVRHVGWGILLGLAGVIVVAIYMDPVDADGHGGSSGD